MKRSTVKIHCSFGHSYSAVTPALRHEDSLWFTKTSGGEPVNLREDPQYSGRVEVQCSDNNCTLTIRDLRETDTAQYRFTFRGDEHVQRSTASPGVNLTVTGNILIAAFSFPNVPTLKKKKETPRAGLSQMSMNFWNCLSGINRSSPLWDVSNVNVWQC